MKKFKFLKIHAIGFLSIISSSCEIVPWEEKISVNTKVLIQTKLVSRDKLKFVNLPSVTLADYRPCVIEIDDLRKINDPNHSLTRSDSLKVGWVGIYQRIKNEDRCCLTAVFVKNGEFESVHTSTQISKINGKKFSFLLKIP